MSTKKKNQQNAESLTNEIREGSFKKGTFEGLNGEEIEYTEDENGQIIFYNSHGNKVIIPHSPSREACVNFLRIVQKIRLNNKLR